MSEYCTPEIEDLHIGSRYELRENGIWSSKSISKPYDIEFVYRTLKQVYMNGPSVRVKYLDQDDIKS